MPSETVSDAVPSGIQASAAELPPDILKAIEAEMKTSVSDVPPELVQHAVAIAKKCGNEAFTSKRYRDALQFYTQAIAGSPADKSLRSNRSATYLLLGDNERALDDAVRCVALDNDWPKAHYRLGKALAALGEWHAASATLERCARLITGVGLTDNTDGINDETIGTTDEPTTATPPAHPVDTKTLAGVLDLLAIAKAESEDHRCRLSSTETVKRKDLAARLREARRADDREATLTRWRQTMSGPEWSVDEHEWRPTFPPTARLGSIDPNSFNNDNRRGGAILHARTLAELAAPKNSLEALEDAGRLRAYAIGVTNAIAQAKGKLEEVEATEETTEGVLKAGTQTKVVTTLCIAGGGPGVLPLSASHAGSDRVFSVERGRFSFRAARGVVRANEENGKVDKNIIQVLDRPVTAIDLKGDMDGFKANVLVTDLLDRAGGLGMGVLSALDACATHGLLTQDVVVVPQKLRTFAKLVQIRIENVRGFDLRTLNNYRWHPQTAKFSPDREPHVVVSDTFEVFDVDVQERVRQKVKQFEDGGDDETLDAEKSENASSGNSNRAAQWDTDATVKIPITQDGVWNAVVFWFEAGLWGGEVLRSATPPGELKDELTNANNDAPTRQNTHKKTIHTGSSWGLAAQYLDEVFVRKGESVDVRIRRDTNQVYFQSVPAATIPRRAAIPMWHYDMLNDFGRNEAYDKCITSAVAKYKGYGYLDTGNVNSHRNYKNYANHHLSVIDAGSGSGLLAMIAARAGADQVTAIERSAHMTDVGEEICAVNGFAGRITCLHRDVRHVFTHETPGLPFNGALKPDGVVTEMQSKANMMVYEIFDSGLIGEGALHVLAYAKERLLKENSILVPAKAQVFAQLIETRHGLVSLDGMDNGVDTNDRTNSDQAKRSYDFGHCNRWRWRDEYEGINLEKDKTKWRPLSEIKKVFDFDFYKVSAQTLAPESKPLRFKINENGTCNAVAFWFELDVGTDKKGNKVTLSTSPHDGTKGQTWQQAVQYFEEFDVLKGRDSLQDSSQDSFKGDSVPINASHDTYGIRFDVDDGLFPERAERRDPKKHAPSHDPVWGAALARAKQVDNQLNKILTQNPLEYRAVAETAIAAGARPHDLGFEAEQGADFCIRLMG